MVTANVGSGQDHSGMIDMKVLMEAHRAHAAPVPPLCAPVLGTRPAAPEVGSKKQLRALFAIAIGTLAIALGTAAVALAMPREVIRGRVGPKVRQAAPLVVETPVVETPVATPEVETPAVEPEVVTTPRGPRPRRLPRVTRPISPPAETREVTPPRRDPNRPLTIDELMNEALR
jgi:hypothetical protein